MNNKYIVRFQIPLLNIPTEQNLFVAFSLGTIPFVWEPECEQRVVEEELLHEERCCEWQRRSVAREMPW
jgi:hypothetical protein